MRNFQCTFETRKQSFISVFQICKTVRLLKCLFNKVLLYLFYSKDMVKPYCIKGVHRVKKTAVRRGFTQ